MRIDEARAIVELAETAEEGLHGPEQLAWKRRLEEAAPAMAAAVDALLGEGDAEAAQRLTGSLSVFWQDSGRAQEGRALSRRALEAGTTDPRIAARATLTEAELAFRQGDQDGSRAGGEAAIALAT